MGKKRNNRALQQERSKIYKRMKYSNTAKHSSIKTDIKCSVVNERVSNKFVKRLAENEVGITEYVNNTPGFTGVLKARFSDFHVNEINNEGNEVKLTDQTIPKMASKDLDKQELEEYKKDLAHIVTASIWDKLSSMFNNVTCDDFITIDVKELDKNTRTRIHKLLKQEYGNKIITTTEDYEGQKVIKCCKSKSNGNKIRNTWSWLGEYVWFVVYKENADTLQAASDLARYLKLQPSRVHYAGTKDKRAKTSQQFCVKKREPSQIMRAANFLKYMHVGNFQIKTECLQLGKLKGNRFKIVLRHVNGDNKYIEKSIQNLERNGFINYYGLQRFGNNAEVPTYKIGLAILKENYKEACELILKPRDGDSASMKDMREHWWKHRDSIKAAAMIKNDKFIEKKLLEGLAIFGENDYATALMRIPRNMLLLYTHAYQSLIWNKIASRRIKEFGMSLLPGDLIYKHKENEEEVTEVEPLCLLENDVAEDVNSEEKRMSPKDKVMWISSDDVLSKEYTIFDIVLPLPGYDIIYPSNIVGKWYEELLAADGLSSAKLKHKVKTFSLAGAYRKLLIRPENVKFEFKNYDSPSSNLVASDYDELKGTDADSDKPNGSLKALILDFCLPSSSYATMSLREILKSDTSCSNQDKINIQQEDQEKNNTNPSYDNRNNEEMQRDCVADD